MIVELQAMIRGYGPGAQCTYSHETGADTSASFVSHMLSSELIEQLEHSWKEDSRLAMRLKITAAWSTRAQDSRAAATESSCLSLHRAPLCPAHKSCG